MTLRFTKEIIPNQYNSSASLYGRPRVYKVFDENGSLIGESHHDTQQYFTYNSEEIRIDGGTSFFTKTRHTIRNATIGQRIGEITINGFGMSRFWQDVPSDPNSKVIIGRDEFYFRRIAPDVEPFFLKRNTWGYYRFRLYALKSEVYAEYSLKMAVPIFNNKNYIKFRPFEGSVETNFVDLLPMFTAFSLMEGEFNAEKYEFSG
jgi:hypothetical protein